jgi:hypothetical protein
MIQIILDFPLPARLEEMGLNHTSNRSSDGLNARISEGGSKLQYSLVIKDILA